MGDIYIFKIKESFLKLEHKNMIPGINVLFQKKTLILFLKVEKLKTGTIQDGA